MTPLQRKSYQAAQIKDWIERKHAHVSHWQLCAWRRQLAELNAYIKTHREPQTFLKF